MKFTLSLLLVVVFATYKFGETLPTRNMAYDNDEGIEKTHLWYKVLANKQGILGTIKSLEEDSKNNKMSLAPKDFIDMNQQNFQKHRNGEKDIGINRFSLTPKDIADMKIQTLFRRNGSGTSLKKMDLNEEDIPINEGTRDLFGISNPEPESQPVSEPAEEDGFNQMENKDQNVSEATKTESSSVSPILINCTQSYISTPKDLDGLLLTLWEIIVQLFNFILCLVSQCVCEDSM